jgi:hypothetical protein
VRGRARRSCCVDRHTLARQHTLNTSGAQGCLIIAKGLARGRRYHRCRCARWETLVEGTCSLACPTHGGDRQSLDAGLACVGRICLPYRRGPRCSIPEGKGGRKRFGLEQRLEGPLPEHTWRCMRTPLTERQVNETRSVDLPAYGLELARRTGRSVLSEVAACLCFPPPICLLLAAGTCWFPRLEGFTTQRAFL